MEITLTPELEKAVRDRFASGLYESESEVVREALRRSLQQDDVGERLRREAAVGFEQLENGETVEISGREAFFELARRRS
tara:strand:+ start:91 stop:330 length:240 start_codon:yes stop_codon:yes gene_type:complete